MTTYGAGGRSYHRPYYTRRVQHLARPSKHPRPHRQKGMASLLILGGMSAYTSVKERREEKKAKKQAFNDARFAELEKENGERIRQLEDKGVAAPALNEKGEHCGCKEEFGEKCEKHRDDQHESREPQRLEHQSHGETPERSIDANANANTGALVSTDGPQQQQLRSYNPPQPPRTTPYTPQIQNAEGKEKAEADYAAIERRVQAESQAVDEVREAKARRRWLARWRPRKEWELEKEKEKKGRKVGFEGKAMVTI